MRNYAETVQDTGNRIRHNIRIVPADFIYFDFNDTAGLVFNGDSATSSCGGEKVRSKWWMFSSPLVLENILSLDNDDAVSISTKARNSRWYRLLPWNYSRSPN